MFIFIYLRVSEYIPIMHPLIRRMQNIREHSACPSMQIQRKQGRE